MPQAALGRLQLNELVEQIGEDVSMPQAALGRLQPLSSIPVSLGLMCFDAASGIRSVATTH